MKTAVITGASSGLGREMARRISLFFPDIRRVILVARRAERLTALAEELKKDQGIDCLTLPADLANEGGLSALRDLLAKEKPEVGLLVNGAGCGLLGDFDKMELSGQMNMVNLNVGGLTAVTGLTLPYMARGGRIVNISSIASFVPNARLAVYSASKYYVRAFSRALGLELKKRGISVTAVCPGPMDTEFLPLAGIEGNSRVFDILPRVPVEKAATLALKYAAKGRPVCTPGGFYKFYRVVSALVPDTILMRAARA